MKQEIIDICKIGQGKDCCKFFLASSLGFECAKKDETLKTYIENNWDSTKVAQGDNCEGKFLIN
jgi:hypothetical protein